MEQGKQPGSMSFSYPFEVHPNSIWCLLHLLRSPFPTALQAPISGILRLLLSSAVKYRNDYRHVAGKRDDGCRYGSAEREDVCLKVSKRASLARHEKESENDENT